ncbi:hypothetical protein M901_0991, partial [Bacteriovorax sp. DB6_IX]
MKKMTTVALLTLLSLNTVAADLRDATLQGTSD